MSKKTNNNRLIWWTLGLVLILVALAVVARMMGWTKGDNRQEVIIAEAKKVTIVEKVSASGKVQPVNEVKISPDVPGEIRELYVVEGQEVTKGTLLLRIRPDNYQSAYDRQVALLNSQKAALSQARSRVIQSEARFRQVELQHKRNEKLFAEKAISLQDLETSQANYDAALAELEAAKQSIEAAEYQVKSAEAAVRDANETLKLTSVFAPMSGIITKLSVEKGERVVGTATMAGTEMLRIADLERMEVRVDVNENDIIRISLGDTAVIEVDSYSYMEEKFKGIVTSIANSAKTTANSQLSNDAVTEFEVRILIIKDSYKHLLKPGMISPFRPGMSASVEIITEVKSDVVGVPLSAVTARKKDLNDSSVEDKDNQESLAETSSNRKRNKEVEELKEYVFVLKGDTAKLQPVKTGISDFDNIEILSGLALGQKVVVGPYVLVSKKLQDGDLVKPKRDDDSGKKLSKRKSF